MAATISRRLCATAAKTFLLIGSSLRRARGRGSRRGRGRHVRIDPAGVDAGAQAFRRLGVDVSLPHDTPEGCLDVSCRAAESIVEIEMAECRVEIVAPEQVDHPSAEPDAFGISCGTGKHTRGFGELVDLLFFLLS